MVGSFHTVVVKRRGATTNILVRDTAALPHLFVVPRVVLLVHDTVSHAHASNGIHPPLNFVVASSLDVEQGRMYHLEEASRRRGRERGRECEGEERERGKEREREREGGY